MPESLTLAPTPSPRTFRAPDGSLLTPPADWACLPPGDAGLTRRVKAAGPSWVVVEKRGRKISRRVYGLRRSTSNRRARPLSPNARQTATPGAANRTCAGVKPSSPPTWSASNPRCSPSSTSPPAGASLAASLAAQVTALATPVGSGTVARTERIPVEQRAEAAVVAWMRHQTTLYDRLKIPRIKGMRRQVRRELASISRVVLDRHRLDDGHGSSPCPLCAALAPGTPAPER